jgi:hypothetical protein
MRALNRMGAVYTFATALAVVGICTEVARAQLVGGVDSTTRYLPGAICACEGCQMTPCLNGSQCANVASNRQRCGAPVSPSSPNACQAENDECARLLVRWLGFDCWSDNGGCGGQLAYIYIP